VIVATIIQTPWVQQNYCLHLAPSDSACEKFNQL